MPWTLGSRLSLSISASNSACGVFSLEHDGVGANAQFLGLGAFHADVGPRGRVLADAHEGDAGRDAVLLAQGEGAGLGLGVDLGGDGLAVDESCAGHGLNLRPCAAQSQGRCIGCRRLIFQRDPREFFR